jgi:hypothetical protein
MKGQSASGLRHEFVRNCAAISRAFTLVLLVLKRHTLVLSRVTTYLSLPTRSRTYGKLEQQ